MYMIAFTWHNPVRVMMELDGSFRFAYIVIQIEGYQIFTDDDVLLESHYYEGKTRRTFRQGEPVAWS